MHIKDLQNDATQAVRLPDGLTKESVAWEIQDAAWLPDSTRFVANAHPSSEDRGIWSSPTTSIWLLSRLGGPPRKLRENAMYWAVLPDGFISFGTNRERESWLMGPGGEQARKLLDGDLNSALIGPIAQSSVDKEIILYGRHDSSSDSLLTRDLRGGPVTTIFTPAEMRQVPGDFAWLSDGRLIYEAFDSGSARDIKATCNFWALRLDLRTGKPVGQPQRLTNWTGFCSGGINITADGKHAAFLQISSHGTGYIAELAAGGTRIASSRHFTLEEADDGITDWTADSKSVILASHRGDGYNLYKQLLSSDTPQLLTSIPKGGEEQANVSPDGKWIIALNYLGPAELNQIVRVPVEGGRPQLILKSREMGASYSCARPPSKRCVLSEMSEDHKQMVVSEFDPVRGKGDELARFEFDPQFDPTVTHAIWGLSPNGARFAISRGPAGPIQIYAFTDHSTRLIHPKGSVQMANLTWSADGKAFYFSNRTKDGMELLHMDMEGNTTSLWKNNGVTFCGPSPDGRYLAILDLKSTSSIWMMENF